MDTLFQYIPICEDFWSQLLSVSSSCKGKFKNVKSSLQNLRYHLHYINSMTCIMSNTYSMNKFCLQIPWFIHLWQGQDIIISLPWMYDIKSLNLSNKNFHQIQSSLRIINITHLLYCKYIYPILKCHTI